MDFTKKILVLCMVFCAALCSADENRNRYFDADRITEACFVQHLKTKGKLDEVFQSTLQSSSQCQLIIPTVMQALQSTVTDEIRNEFPNEAECLISEFHSKEAVDYLLKLDVINGTSLLSVSAREIQLEETRNQFEDVLKEIAVECLVDDENFVKIFNKSLGINNEILEAYQQQYCLAKYVVDNQILKLENVDINPHHIDPESVNCNYIIDLERIKIEKEYGKTPAAGSLDCHMEAFRLNNMFGYKVAKNILRDSDLNIPIDDLENHNIRLNVKVNEFYFILTSKCGLRSFGK